LGADPLVEAAMKPVEPISPYEVADTRCLLIASIFAPIHGGSAEVYESPARSVVPAKAGTQRLAFREHWIPASAGMTPDGCGSAP